MKKMEKRACSSCGMKKASLMHAGIFLRLVLGQKLAVAQLFKFLMVEPRFYSHFSYFFLVFNNVVLFRRRASKIRGATWCLTNEKENHDSISNAFQA